MSINLSDSMTNIQDFDTAEDRHTIRLTCRVCHSMLTFSRKATRPGIEEAMAEHNAGHQPDEREIEHIAGRIVRTIEAGDR